AFPCRRRTPPGRPLPWPLIFLSSRPNTALGRTAVARTLQAAYIAPPFRDDHADDPVHGPERDQHGRAPDEWECDLERRPPGDAFDHVDRVARPRDRARAACDV